MNKIETLRFPLLLVALLIAVLLWFVPAQARELLAWQDNNVWWNEVYHNTREAYYRTPFGAVPTGQTVTIRLRTAVNDLSDATLVVYNMDPSDDTDGTPDGTYWNVQSTPVASDSTYDYYEFTVSASSTRILYYKFRLRDGSDCDWYVDDYAHDNYDHEDRYENGTGQMVEGASGNQCGDSAAGYANNSFNITVYDNAFTVPDWAQNAVVYQIMPDRFRNGDSSNDSAWPYGDVYGTPIHLHTTWNEAPDDPRDSSSPYYQHWSADFFGGDLQGIMDELDYLQSLGVTALYLNPIFSAPSNHGYDTTDYLKINPRYGDLALFQTLATEAEARGIKIILDGVFNHTGSDSRYFDRYNHWDAAGNPDTAANTSGACEHESSAYNDFYTFNAGSGPCTGRTDGNEQYDSWWGYDTLPLLNENTAVKDFIFDYSDDDASPSAVVQYWYSQGADGWRFDVADELSHTFWREFRAQVKGNDALDGPLYGEIWYEAQPWLYGDQLDASMNYRYRKAVLGFLVDSDWTDNDNQADRTVWSLTPSEFDYVLGSIREDYPAPAWYAMMNLMGSHDTNRALFVLRERSTDLNAALGKMKMLAALQFTYPGAPTIYYGDETGLGAADWGGYGLWGAGKSDGTDIQDDPYNRHPYPWEDASGALPASGGVSLPVNDLRSTYRTLGFTRNNYDVLRTGDVTTLLADDTNRLYAYARTDGASPACAVAIFNRDTAVHSVTLDLSAVSAACPNGLTLYDVLNSGAAWTVSGTSLTVNNLPALGAAVLLPAFDNPNTPDSVASLPPARVQVSATADQVAANGNVTVQATVYDIVGNPLPAGVTVNFAVVNGNGTLSSATALTDGSGMAQVTYNAPGGSEVAVLRAGLQSPDGVVRSGATSVFVGYQAGVAQISTTQTGIGPERVSLSGVVDVLKQGTGEPVITLAELSNVPNAGNVYSPYVDVHLSDAAGVDALVITVPYTDETGEANHALYYYLGSGTWSQVSSSTVDTIANTVTFTATTSSTPALSGLTGTPFVVGNTAGDAPTALEVVTFTGGGKAPGWSGLAAVLGVIALAGGWIVLGRRRR